MGTEDTIDIVVIGIIALVVAYIVYEISQATSSLQNSTGGLFAPVAAGAAGIGVGGYLAFLLLL
jgi:hypothetical protein